MSGPSSRPSASPPSWLRGVKAAGSPANMMAALAADIRSEVRSTNRDRRDASEAAFTRLQRDAKRDALTRSSARSSHASEAQSSAASPQRSSTLYHELLYAEGMLGLAERARWVEEAKGVLTAQEMAGCTFAPELDAHSQELVAQARIYEPDTARPLAERTEEVIAEQKHRQKLLADIVENARRAECETPARSPRATPRRSDSGRSGRYGYTGGSSCALALHDDSSTASESFLEGVSRNQREQRDRLQQLRSNVHAETFTPRLCDASMKMLTDRSPSTPDAHGGYMKLTRAYTSRRDNRPTPGSGPPVSVTRDFASPTRPIRASVPGSAAAAAGQTN